MFLPSSLAFTTSSFPNPAVDESLWYPAEPPVPVVANNEPTAVGVNIGVIFTVSVAGGLHSICYYRVSDTMSPSGTVALWQINDVTGDTLLGQADYTGHSGTGWQVIPLPEAVTLSPSKGYMAHVWLPSNGTHAVEPLTAFHFQNGRYSQPWTFLYATADVGQFDPRGFNRRNGMITVGAFTRPVGSFNSGNYWVDVIYNAPPTPDPPDPPLTMRWEIPEGYPTPETTGPDPDTVFGPPELDPAASLADGEIIENRDFRNVLTIYHNNVTVRNCKIRNRIINCIYILAGTTGTHIHDCSIDGVGRRNVPMDGIRIGGTEVLIERCDIFRIENGTSCFGHPFPTNVTIRDCCIHHMRSGPGVPHYDGLEFDGGQTTVRLTHNSILNENVDTSAIMINSELGAVDDFIIEDNFLCGGGYTIYCNKQGDILYPITNVHYINNKMHVGREGYMIFGWEPGPVMQGTQFLDHGAIFDAPPPGGFVDGQVVPESLYGYARDTSASIIGEPIDAATGGITLGTGFRVAVDGQVVGVNFRRPAFTSTLLIKVGLWRFTGSSLGGGVELLAEAEETNAIKLGLQHYAFAEPIDVQAGDDLVLGVFIPRGSDGKVWYFARGGAFWPNPKPSQWGRYTAYSNNPATQLAGFSGGNGLYHYGSALTPPLSTTGLDSDYAVDPVFVAPASVVAVTAASVTMNARVGGVTVSVGDGTVSAVVNAVGSAATASRGTVSITAKRQVTVNATGLGRPAVVGTASASTPALPSGWPDSTNTGYLHAPGYPGSLTTWGGGSLTAGATYSFIDFTTAGDVLVNVANVTFIGCRFQQNWTDGWAIKVNVNAALAATFKFCTIRPHFSVTIPNAAWPSAGTGVDVDGSTGGGYEPYMIAYADSYQYGILQTNGGILVEDCDIWGFGNSIVLFGTHQKTIRRCWIHDASEEGSGSTMYHQDGPGHLDGSGCSNVLIEDCTIASLGNTNGIAFQAGTYNNIIVRRNFLAGFGYTVDMCHNTAGNTNLTFQDNTIATDVSWHFGPIYTNFTNFSAASNLWRGNKLRVLAGTVPRPGSSPTFTLADHGKFVLPNGSFSTTDYE